MVVLNFFKLLIESKDEKEDREDKIYLEKSPTIYKCICGAFNSREWDHCSNCGEKPN